MASTPQILDVYPANGALGIPTGDSVTITFDQEMDEDSINTGTFIVAAPDKGVFFGGEIAPFDEPGLDDEDILSSPYNTSYVKGTITFSRINASGTEVDDSEVDYDGDGDLWYTVALFTPEKPLEPNKEYTVLVAGDEDITNQFDTGVKTRTVFDAEPTITGTGTLYAGGGFTGDIAQSYVVKITGAGATGVATYQWHRVTDPLTVYDGVTTTGQRELEDGLYIEFGPDGTCNVDDSWSIACIPAISLPVTYRWTFSTGSGAIVVPPSSSSASGIDSLTTTGTSTFSVLRMTPQDGSTNHDSNSITAITIKLSADIDTDVFTDSMVSVVSESVNGDPNIASVTGTLANTIDVSGDTITITLDADQLYNNNVVLITLSEDLQSTDGNTLGEDTILLFTTTYDPLYTHLRRIRLDLGQLVADVRDDVIMLAIFEASLQASAMSFVTAVTNGTFRLRALKEYTTCLAELILVNSIATDISRIGDMSKKLGDLYVSRGGFGKYMNNLSDKLEKCIAKWQLSIQSNGCLTSGTSLSPLSGVKGSSSADAITVDRHWNTEEGQEPYPASNTSIYGVNSRRNLRSFNRRW